MKEALEPIAFDKYDIKDLDSINRLILQNTEKLMDSNFNHVSSDFLPAKDNPKRKRHWYFTKPWMIEKYLQIEKGSLGFLNRHSYAGEDQQRNFVINDISFHPADSLFKYEIKMIVVGDTVVLHQLYYKITAGRIRKLQSSIKKKTKVNRNWTYIIYYYIDDEWS